MSDYLKENTLSSSGYGIIYSGNLADSDISINGRSLSETSFKENLQLSNDYIFLPLNSASSNATLSFCRGEALHGKILDSVFTYSNGDFSVSAGIR